MCKDVKSWLTANTSKIHQLIGHQLKAAVLVFPAQVLQPLAFLQSATWLPDEWTLSLHKLENTSNGGAIKIHLQVLLVFPKETAQGFLLPPHTSPPLPMHEFLSTDVVSESKLDLSGMIVREPTLIECASEEKAQSAKIAKLIKNQANVKAGDGWPAFDSQGPAPSIMKPCPEENFFDSLFVVWQYFPEHPNNAVC